jgi:hypothetical protein
MDIHRVAPLLQIEDVGLFFGCKDLDAAYQHLREWEKAYGIEPKTLA